MNLLIVLVFKEKKKFLLAFVFLLCLNPAKNVYGQTLLPFEIRIIDVSYPPIVSVHDEQDSDNTYIRYGLDVKYELENPNDETVSILMGNCYNLPFYHINASFEEKGLRISYGHGAWTMVCSQSFETGLKAKQTERIKFGIDSYSDENLPNGFYTLWLDINYDDVNYPTIVSHAFMNITDEGVEIRIEWGDKTDNYFREVEFSFSFIFIPILAMSVLVLLMRKRKNKKYFI